jgi:hypothetical protein
MMKDAIVCVLATGTGINRGLCPHVEGLPVPYAPVRKNEEMCERV